MSLELATCNSIASEKLTIHSHGKLTEGVMCFFSTKIMSLVFMIMHNASLQFYSVFDTYMHHLCYLTSFCILSASENFKN